MIWKLNSIVFVFFSVCLTLISIVDSRYASKYNAKDSYSETSNTDIGVLSPKDFKEKFFKNFKLTKQTFGPNSFSYSFMEHAGDGFEKPAFGFMPNFAPEHHNLFPMMPGCDPLKHPCNPFKGGKRNHKNFFRKMFSRRRPIEPEANLPFYEEVVIIRRVPILLSKLLVAVALPPGVVRPQNNIPSINQSPVSSGDDTVQSNEEEISLEKSPSSPPMESDESKIKNKPNKDVGNNFDIEENEEEPILPSAYSGQSKESVKLTDKKIKQEKIHEQQLASQSKSGLNELKRKTDLKEVEFVKPQQTNFDDKKPLNRDDDVDDDDNNLEQLEEPKSNNNIKY